MNEQFEFKSAASGAISLDEMQGIVECFVAGIGNKDSVGDIVVTGAFAKSLTRRKPRVVWAHSWNDPIGKVLEMYEVPPGDSRLPAKMRNAGIGGLYAKVQFNLQSEKGKEAFASVAFFGEEQEWSIGYKTINGAFDPAQQANVLKEVELYEVSPVLHGANQLTGTISVKSEQKNHMMPIIAGMPMMGEQQQPRMIVIAAPEKEQEQDEPFNIFAEGLAQPLEADKVQKIQAELSERTGSKVDIVEATDSFIVFRRTTTDGKVSMYRVGYHTPDGYNTFMFGKPEAYSGSDNKPQIQQEIEVKPADASMVPMQPQQIPYRDDDQDEMNTMLGGQVGVGKSAYAHLIEIPQIHMVQAKSMLQPVFNYHKLSTTDSDNGIIVNGSISAQAIDALQNAVKAIGQTIGQSVGNLRTLAQSFNPYAIDGDNDGFAQDGTAFQRPYIPIKKPDMDLPEVGGKKRNSSELLDKPTIRTGKKPTKDPSLLQGQERQEALAAGELQPRTMDDISFLANRRPENEGLAKYWDMSEEGLRAEGQKLVAARRGQTGSAREATDGELFKISHEFSRREAYKNQFGKEFVPPKRTESTGRETFDVSGVRDILEEGNAPEDLRPGYGFTGRNNPRYEKPKYGELLAEYEKNRSKRGFSSRGDVTPEQQSRIDASRKRGSDIASGRAQILADNLKNLSDEDKDFIRENGIVAYLLEDGTGGPLSGEWAGDSPAERIGDLLPEGDWSTDSGLQADAEDIFASYEEGFYGQLDKEFADLANPADLETEKSRWDSLSADEQDSILEQGRDSARGLSSRGDGLWGDPRRSIEPDDEELSDEYIEQWLTDKVKFDTDITFDQLEKYNSRTGSQLSDSQLEDLHNRYLSDDKTISDEAGDEILSKFFRQLEEDYYDDMVEDTIPEPDYEDYMRSRDGFASRGLPPSLQKPTPLEELEEFKNFLDREYGDYFMDYTQMDDEELKKTLMKRYAMTRSEANATTRQIRKHENKLDDLTDAMVDAENATDGFASLGKWWSSYDELSDDDKSDIEQAYFENNPGSERPGSRDYNPEVAQGDFEANPEKYGYAKDFEKQAIEALKANGAREDDARNVTEYWMNNDALHDEYLKEADGDSLYAMALAYDNYIEAAADDYNERQIGFGSRSYRTNPDGTSSDGYVVMSDGQTEIRFAAEDGDGIYDATRDGFSIVREVGGGGGGRRRYPESTATYSGGGLSLEERKEIIDTLDGSSDEFIQKLLGDYRKRGRLSDKQWSVLKNRADKEKKKNAAKKPSGFVDSRRTGDTIAPGARPVVSAGKESIVTPTAEQIADADALEKLVNDARYNGQTLRFNYNGKNREVFPVQTFKNPKTGKVNMVGQDSEGVKKTFTIDKMSPFEDNGFGSRGEDRGFASFRDGMYDPDSDPYFDFDEREPDYDATSDDEWDNIPEKVQTEIINDIKEYIAKRDKSAADNVALQIDDEKGLDIREDSFILEIDGIEYVATPALKDEDLFKQLIESGERDWRYSSVSKEDLFRRIKESSDAVSEGRNNGLLTKEEADAIDEEFAKIKSILDNPQSDFINEFRKSRNKIVEITNSANRRSRDLNTGDGNRTRYEHMQTLDMLDDAPSALRVLEESFRNKQYTGKKSSDGKYFITELEDFAKEAINGEIEYEVDDDGDTRVTPQWTWWGDFEKFANGKNKFVQENQDLMRPYFRNGFASSGDATPEMRPYNDLTSKEQEDLYESIENYLNGRGDWARIKNELEEGGFDYDDFLQQNPEFHPDFADFGDAGDMGFGSRSSDAAMGLGEPVRISKFDIPTIFRYEELDRQTQKDFVDELDADGYFDGDTYSDDEKLRLAAEEWDGRGLTTREKYTDEMLSELYEMEALAEGFTTTERRGTAYDGSEFAYVEEIIKNPMSADYSDYEEARKTMDSMRASLSKDVLKREKNQDDANTLGEEDFGLASRGARKSTEDYEKDVAKLTTISGSDMASLDDAYGPRAYYNLMEQRTELIKKRREIATEIAEANGITITPNTDIYDVLGGTDNPNFDEDDYNMLDSMDSAIEEIDGLIQGHRDDYARMKSWMDDYSASWNELQDIEKSLNRVDSISDEEDIEDEAGSLRSILDDLRAFTNPDKYGAFDSESDADEIASLLEDPSTTNNERAKKLLRTALDESLRREEENYKVAESDLNSVPEPFDELDWNENYPEDRLFEGRTNPLTAREAFGGRNARADETARQTLRNSRSGFASRGGSRFDTFETPNSSAIEAVHYDRNTGELHVAFKPGQTGGEARYYTYSGVPADYFDNEVRGSNSIGRVINDVKKNYDVEVTNPRTVDAINGRGDMTPSAGGRSSAIQDIDVRRSAALYESYYDPNAEELVVTFKDKDGNAAGSYIYEGVTADEANELASASSKGKIINRLKASKSVRRAGANDRMERTPGAEDDLGAGGYEAQVDAHWDKIGPEEQRAYFARAVDSAINAGTGTSADEITADAKARAYDDRQIAMMEMQAEELGMGYRKIDVGSSAALNRVEYDPDKRELRVEYRGRDGKGNGEFYVYQNVPQSVVDDIEASDSRGATLRRVRDDFEFRTETAIPESAFYSMGDMGERSNPKITNRTNANGFYLDENGRATNYNKRAYTTSDIQKINGRRNGRDGFASGRLGPPPDDAEYGRELAAQRARDRAAGRNATNPIGNMDRDGEPMDYSVEDGLASRASINESSTGQRIVPSRMHSDDREALAEITDPEERKQRIDELIEFYGPRIFAKPSSPRRKRIVQTQDENGFWVGPDGKPADFEDGFASGGVLNEEYDDLREFGYSPEDKAKNDEMVMEAYFNEFDEEAPSIEDAYEFWAQRAQELREERSNSLMDAFSSLRDEVNALGISDRELGAYGLDGAAFLTAESLIDNPLESDSTDISEAEDYVSRMKRSIDQLAADMPEEYDYMDEEPMDGFASRQTSAFNPDAPMTLLDTELDRNPSIFNALDRVLPPAGGGVWADSAEYKPSINTVPWSNMTRGQKRRVADDMIDNNRAYFNKMQRDGASLGEIDDEIGRLYDEEAKANLITLERDLKRASDDYSFWARQKAEEMNPTMSEKEIDDMLVDLGLSETDFERLFAKNMDAFEMAAVASDLENKRREIIENIIKGSNQRTGGLASGGVDFDRYGNIPSRPKKPRRTGDPSLRNTPKNRARMTAERRLAEMANSGDPEYDNLMQRAKDALSKEGIAGYRLTNEYGEPNSLVAGKMQEILAQDILDGATPKTGGDRPKVDPLSILGGYSDGDVIGLTPRGFASRGESGVKRRTKEDVFADMQKQLIDALEDPENLGKWKLPWRRTGMPENGATGKKYSGSNWFFLSVMSDIKGYDSNKWATYNQWQGLGGQVRKGEKGTQIFVPMFMKGKEKADGTMGEGKIIFKAATVFNLKQIDGMPADFDKKEILPEAERVADLEKTISEIPAVIKNGGDRAFFQPSGDFIQVPNFENFNDARSYYSTVGHELMHWTGGKGRLDREQMGAFGTPEYAYEELVAEIASAIFMSSHNIEPDIQENHGPYLASWLKALKQDPDALQKAMTDAQKAVNYILDISPNAKSKFSNGEKAEFETPEIAVVGEPVVSVEGFASRGDWPTPGGYEPSEFDMRTALSQIGRGNLMAISGTRAKKRNNEMVLPVNRNQQVIVGYDGGSDTYFVRAEQIITNGKDKGKTRVLGQWDNVYADELGETAYQASLKPSMLSDENKTVWAQAFDHPQTGSLLDENGQVYEGGFASGGDSMDPDELDAMDWAYDAAQDYLMEQEDMMPEEPSPEDGFASRMNLSTPEKNEIIAIARRMNTPFTRSVVAQYDRNGELSDRQWDALNRMTLRGNRGGFPSRGDAQSSVSKLEKIATPRMPVEYNENRTSSDAFEDTEMEIGAYLEYISSAMKEIIGNDEFNKKYKPRIDKIVNDMQDERSRYAPPPKWALDRAVKLHDEMISESRMNRGGGLASRGDKGPRTPKARWSPEDRQRFADGDRLRSKKRPGKRRSGPDASEYGFASRGDQKNPIDMIERDIFFEGERSGRSWGFEPIIARVAEKFGGTDRGSMSDAQLADELGIDVAVAKKMRKPGARTSDIYLLDNLRIRVAGEDRTLWGVNNDPLAYYDESGNPITDYDKIPDVEDTAPDVPGARGPRTSRKRKYIDPRAVFEEVGIDPDAPVYSVSRGNTPSARENAKIFGRDTWRRIFAEGITADEIDTLLKAKKSNKRSADIYSPEELNVAPEPRRTDSMPLADVFKNQAFDSARGRRGFPQKVVEAIAEITGRRPSISAAKNFINNPRSASGSRGKSPLTITPAQIRLLLDKLGISAEEFEKFRSE